MKGRLVVLALLAAACALGQSGFVWDFSGYFYPGLTGGFVGNGDIWFGAPTGGSLMWPNAVTGANPSDYELETTIFANTGGGTYMHFLRANSTSVMPGTGSYISVELAVPSNFQAGGAVPLAVNQCVNGSISAIGGRSISLHPGDVLRSVIWGTNLWVFLNDVRVGIYTVPSTTGQPGYGGYNIAQGFDWFMNPYAGAGGQGFIRIGHHDTAAPAAVTSTMVATSLLPTSVSLKWQGVADDPVGIGVYQYVVSRNGVPTVTINEPEYADATVTPSTTYTYSVQAMDYHGNFGAAGTVTVTTPPASAVDPRRVGIFSTGSYWGGGGEQIDTMSGNLHFTIPVATAMGRTGWSVPVSLVYDSQNWRNDNGVNWKLGGDVGYGFGWKMLIGAVTPYYTYQGSGVDHYTYMDSNGAEYRLDHNASGIWTPTSQSVYVWLDTTVSPNRLHFRDGSYWVLGCTSGGTETDAGTMFPTIVEDTYGNQVIIIYDAGAGMPPASYNLSANTSSRPVEIDDNRGRFNFTYDATHHLNWYGNTIGTIGTGSNFAYTSGALQPPFGSDPSFNGKPITVLTQAQIGPQGPWTFGYDTAGAGELTSVISPFGGEIAWTYGSFAYTGNRSLREVSGRYLAPDALHATSPMWSYGISRPDAQNAVVLHSAMTLTDASGVGAKKWSFNTTGSPWQLGLVSEFVQSASAGGTVLQDDVYTWTQDSAGHPYITAKSTTTGQGTGNQQTQYSTQTLDQYGNTTQSVIYPYNNATTPLRTYNNTYVNAAGYLSNYVFNLVSGATVTTGGSTITLASNLYDQGLSMGAPNGYPTWAYDANSPVPSAYRGMLTQTSNPLKSTSIWHFPWGTTGQTLGSDGTTTTASVSQATNYAAPDTISAQSYNQTIGYTAWLGVSQTRGANGESLSMIYDSYGRPSSGASAYGATTNFTYALTAPFSQKETGPSGVTTTTLDGFGRAVRVARGDTSGDQSWTDSVYGPCACSPLGKLQKTSQPYPANGTVAAWTTYTYDGLGRTLSVQQPDGASTTHYVYAGNQTTVTDPAGKWKQMTSDVEGNLITVVEPDPCVTTNTLSTSYTYDWMKHLTGVTMTRPNTSWSGTTCSEPGGSATQTRTFVYNTQGQLTSAANPENGTVTYTYNGDMTLHDKKDARGIDAVYTYDSLKRVTMIQRFYPNPPGNPIEDACQEVKFTYDGNNPVNPSFSQYSYGRLTTVQYSLPGTDDYFITGAGNWFNPDACETSATEMYSYHPAGAVTAKNVQFSIPSLDEYGNPTTGAGNVEVDYAYDSAGRVTTTSYPTELWTSVFTTAYDTMGRPSTLTQGGGGSLGSLQYDFAGRETMLSDPWFSRTTTWNVNGQVTAITGMNQSSPPVSNGGVQYVYSATQNNGQITQAIDSISGETISYQYDSLKRLVSATSTPTNGSSPAAWTQTFQYDGFGNMTAKTLNGTTTQQLPVNSATNRLTYATYDANGNMFSGAGATLYYDGANRLAVAAPTGGGWQAYAYDASNRRVGDIGHFTFYGAQGEKLGVYSIEVCGTSCGGTNTYIAALSSNVWFGGHLIIDSSAAVFQDRLGTNRTGGARFYPYGEEITSPQTANDRVKFGTYTRDSFTGLDYADQRMYASSYGRFNTPDPYRASGGPSDPGSWNRYSYVLGDPINNKDPNGTCAEDTAYSVNVCDTAVEIDPFSYGPSGGGGGGWGTASYWNGAVAAAITAARGQVGATLGSTAQNGIVQGSQDFGLASAALAGEQADLVGFFQGSQSPECDHDLAAVGVTDAQVSSAAGNAHIINGLTSLTSYAQDIYGNSPAANAAAFTYGSESMAQYMSLNVGVAAVSQAPGNNIYINAAWVNGMTVGQQTAMLLHELLHGITGKSDDVIQGNLGLPTNVPSQNIGDKLQLDCFK